MGTNQFAYIPKRGARDAILFLVISWLLAFARGTKIRLYCSDVSGAFDRVDADLLLTKLQAVGIPMKLLEVIRSWLRFRFAQVIVAGTKSKEFVMNNMVYQGTVWGPPLWSIFYWDCDIQ